MEGIANGMNIEKIYKIIAIISVIMCIGLMVWNVVLLKENIELKASIENINGFYNFSWGGKLQLFFYKKIASI